MAINTFNELGRAKGVKLLHINVRSVLHKIDQLRSYFIDSNIAVLTFSESWLKDHISSGLVSIQGYALLRQDRDLSRTVKKRGGGLLTYLNTETCPSYKPLTKHSVSESYIEAQWTQINRENCKNIVICNIYRPPEGDLDKALKYLNTCLKSINRSKSDLYILGDLNVDYSDKKAQSCKKLIFFENSNNLAQMIKGTTRVTRDSNSLLDLILTDDRDVSESGILEHMISDHQPIFAVKKKGRNTKASATFRGRSYKSFDFEGFRDRLFHSEVYNNYENFGPEELWDLILEEIVTYLDAHCPIRNFVIPNYRPDWINDHILDQIRDRDYFYKKAKKTGSIDDWNIAKHLRNTTNKNIRRAKARFVMQKLNQCKGDSSKFWKLIKTVYPTSNINTRTKITLENNNLVLHENDTADFINDFFINIGNVPNPTGSVVSQHNTYAQPDQPVPRRPFNETEVYNLVNSISLSKSSGLENINSKVVKEALKVLISPMTHLFNLSLECGVFPSRWKEATVIPIPKGGDPSQVTNLRPISLLPIPGKVLEKLIHSRISEYLEDNDLLSPFQHGFRKKHSTMGAIHQLVDRIGTNLDKRVPTLVVFIDFRKAFDCVQHNILLAKLRGIGLDPVTLQWIESYLSQRKQKVLANNHFSKQATVKQGVPQGSILGPLLYLLYANDLAPIFKNCGFSFYADDTVLYAKNNNFKASIRNMKNNLRVLNRWCHKNCIYMNISKTKYMLFGSRVSLGKVKEFNLKVEGRDLERVYHYCYLGLTLDPYLNYAKQVNRIVSRVSGKIKQLKRVRTFLNVEAALLVYKNMILPILEYGDIFLTAASKVDRDKLQTLQNRALRTVFQVDRYHSSDILHDEAKLLKLKYRREQHLLQFMFTKRDDKAFCLSRRRQGVNTRSSKKINFVLRKPATEKYKRSISYTGPKRWNTLPSSIQKAPDINNFKLKLGSLLSKRVMRQS